MPRIENWSLQYIQHNSTYSLVGNIYEDDRFPEGEKIHTSRVVKCIDDDRVQTHSGTVYLLGEVDPEYENMYPNAKRRLMQSLKVFGEKNESEE